MTPLLLAALLWVGVHVGIAGSPLRGRLAGRLGEGGFRLLFSLLSVAAITALVLAWRAAPPTPLWNLPAGARWALALAMLPAFWLFAASVLSPNPTSLGQPLGGAVRGVQRITRHPMLWSFAIWAAVHLLAKGTLEGALFFGAFLATALLGMPSIDAKLRARDPEGFAALAARTSILPFAAGPVAWSEIPRRVWVAGLLAWGLTLWLHPGAWPPT
ncbi:NnrU family protein [Roseococcus sp. DSY-14]|uniref:NnrU family protein n=1 Tax=Roseococcus sp. DSY-14 TaxID=3369650 RepID=UPI00387AF17E